MQSEKLVLQNQNKAAVTYQNDDENVIEERQSNENKFKEAANNDEAIGKSENVKSSKKNETNVLVLVILIVTTLISETLLKVTLFSFDQGRIYLEKQIVLLWNDFLIPNLDLKFEKLIKLFLIIPIVIICTIIYFVITLIYYTVKLFLMKI